MFTGVLGWSYLLDPVIFVSVTIYNNARVYSGIASIYNKELYFIDDEPNSNRA